jgi:hypothetical protein
MRSFVTLLVLLGHCLISHRPRRKCNNEADGSNPLLHREIAPALMPMNVVHIRGVRVGMFHGSSGGSSNRCSC